MVDPPRARDWSPLTEDGSDPVPGDWEAVKEAAERYRNMADLIQRCSDTLDSVHEDSQTWVGQTADAFRERSTDLSDSVIRAKGRYAAAAEALEEYWPELKSAQEDSEELRGQAVAEQETLDTYGPLAAESEDEDAENHDQHQELQDQVDTANANIQSLRDQLATIVEDKDRAAQRAADAINEFIDNDGLKHSGGLWGAFQDFMARVGDLAGQIDGRRAHHTHHRCGFRSGRPPQGLQRLRQPDGAQRLGERHPAGRRPLRLRLRHPRHAHPGAGWRAGGLDGAFQRLPLRGLAFGGLIDWNSTKTAPWGQIP